VDLASGTPDLPDNVRETIAKRVWMLAADSRRILAAASVLGRSFDPKVLTEITGLNDEAVEGALADGVAATVVGPDGADRYRFSHALVEDTLYDGLGATRRARLHKAAADALERLSPDDPPVASIAHHLCLALPLGDPARAVEFAHRAAADASANGAHEQAAEHYARALEAARSDTECCLDPVSEARLLTDLGWASAHSGMLPRSAEAFLEAIERSRGEDAALFAEAVLGLGGGVEETVGTNLSPSQDALIDLLEEALRALPEDATYLRALVLTRLAGAQYDAANVDAAQALSAQAVVTARQSGDGWAIATSLATRHTVLSAPEYLHDRLALDAELTELGSARSLQAQVWRIGDLLECGQLGDADDTVKNLEADPIVRFEPRARWYHALYKAMRAQIEGRLEEASMLSEKARIVGEQVGARTAGMSDMTQSIFVAREQGRLEGLAELLDDMAAEHPHQPAFRVSSAWCRSEIGDLERARAQFDDLAREDFALPATAFWLPNMRALADTAYVLGATEAAGILYDRFLPYRDRFIVMARVLSLWGSVEHFLGLLALTANNLPAAQAHLAAACEAHSAMGSPLLVARTELALAVLAERQGNTARADTLRDRVCDISRRNGWTALAAAGGC
jgi:tetratricopeptide (TPR) repeat protein